MEEIKCFMIVSIIAKGFGIGFFVTENLIATNIHCVAGATSVKVKLLDSNIEYGVGWKLFKCISCKRQKPCGFILKDYDSSSKIMIVHQRLW